MKFCSVITGYSEKGDCLLLHKERHQKNYLRPTALLFALSMAAPILFGCGGPPAPPAPVVDPPGMSPGQVMKKPGMSTGKKVVIALAGAALLYYLVKHHKQQAGQDVQYFKSKKTGGIYYRDPKTHQAHWVTKGATEAQEVEVDESEQGDMGKLQGYNKSATGNDYAGEAKDTGDAN